MQEILTIVFHEDHDTRGGMQVNRLSHRESEPCSVWGGQMYTVWEYKEQKEVQQRYEAELPVGDKRLTKTLKRKNWGKRYPCEALKALIKFLGIYKATCMYEAVYICKVVYTLRKELKRS